MEKGGKSVFATFFAQQNNLVRLNILLASLSLMLSEKHTVMRNVVIKGR